MFGAIHKIHGCNIKLMFNKQKWEKLSKWRIWSSSRQFDWQTKVRVGFFDGSRHDISEKILEFSLLILNLFIFHFNVFLIFFLYLGLLIPLIRNDNSYTARSISVVVKHICFFFLSIPTSVPYFVQKYKNKKKKKRFHY